MGEETFGRSRGREVVVKCLARCASRRKGIFQLSEGTKSMWEQESGLASSTSSSKAHNQ
jgi:hypothetical protein